MIPTFSVLLLILITVYITCSQKNSIVQGISGIEDTNTHLVTSEPPTLRIPLSMMFV